MKKWLAVLLDDHYLPAITPLEDNEADRAKAEEWATWLKQEWAERGLTGLNQQRTLMTDTRNAVKAINPHHISLESMNFTTQQWREMNTPTSDAVENRNENQKLIKNPDAIVAKAIELLSSNDWAEVAAGIVVCTGRRSSEVLATASFEFKTNYSVLFKGQLKRKGEDITLQFEIPTLAQSQKVIDALAFLRREVNCSGLTNRQVNQKYGNAVVKACDHQFSNLIPQREGKDNLYTHLFRCIYARIAVLYYCPVRVADIVYMAAIQGHYQILEAPDAELRRSYASTRNYFDYKINDGKGNIDGRQGIKLEQPDVEVIEVFKQPIQQIEVRQLESGINVLAPIVQSRQSKTQTDKTDTDRTDSQEIISPEVEVAPQEKQTRLRAWRSDRARIGELGSRLNTPNQQTTISVALDLAEATFELASLLEVPPEPKAVIAKVKELALHPVITEIAESASSPTQAESELILTQEAGQTHQTNDIHTVVKQHQEPYASEQIPLHEPTDSTAVPGFNQAWLQIAELTKVVTHLTQQLSPIAEFAINQVRSPQPIELPQPVQPQLQQTTSSQEEPEPKPTVQSKAKKAQQTTSKPESHRKKGSAEEHIQRCVQALMRFNDAAQRTHEDRWAINQTSVQRLSGSNREAVKRYLAAHAEEIAQHNGKYNLTERHNTGKGRRGLAIEDIVPLEGRVD